MLAAQKNAKSTPIQKTHIVLGIETSCDETGVAIYHSERGILSHEIASQVDLHAVYGGVVPEIAARDHICKLMPLVQECLKKANLPAAELTGVAYTAGPGLVGALMVGAAFACSYAYALKIPALPVHHLEGHLLMVLLEPRAPAFPFLALLVSGGHTQLIHVEGVGQYQILGESLDDAAGEAFDKTAKLMGLGYPGGPVLAKTAEDGQPNRFIFPRPMTDRPGLDFSFSGLKTCVAQAWNASDKSDATRADIAACFQAAAVDTLVIKCQRALNSTGLTRLVVAGGVGANTVLREALTRMVVRDDAEVFFPPPELCTDNGAMIAFAGFQHFQKQTEGLEFDFIIKAKPRWRL